MTTTASVPSIAAESVAGEAGEPARVLLLHGLWHSPRWLVPLGWRLRREGFRVETFAYASLAEGAAAALPRLIERIQSTQATALVGHSLGGRLAVEALRQAPELAVRRVVCLGSPLLGSAAARGLPGRPARWLLGRSAPWLREGLPAWSGRAELGLVAGTRARGLGRWSARLPGASDGTVAVAETRLPGLCDHCEVPVGHLGLLLSAEAAAQAARFLHRGRFAH